MKRVIEEEEDEADKKRNKSNYRLNMLQLKPDKLSGVALLEHKVTFRQQSIVAKDHKLSYHLDIEV